MLRSVRAADLLADEVDCWPDSGAEVVLHTGRRGVVDLLGQPAVTTVAQPQPEPAIGA